MEQRIINCIRAEQLVHDEMFGLDHEEVWALFLSSGAKFLAKEMIAKGTLTSVSIDSFTILRRALLNNSSNIVLFHNHPSGDPTPSLKDIYWTDKIREACKIMRVELFDHIILGDESFYSFETEKIYHYGTIK